MAIDLTKSWHDQARDGTLTVIEACDYALETATQDARDGGMCLRCGATYHYDTRTIDHLDDCPIEIVELAVKRAKERGET